MHNIVSLICVKYGKNTFLKIPYLKYIDINISTWYIFIKLNFLMKKYFEYDKLTSQFQKYLFSTFVIIFFFRLCNQSILNSMKIKMIFTLKLEYILNILSCTYVKNGFILELAYSLSTFFTYFTMLSAK